MRFGILGCGVIGEVHARLIASQPDRMRLAAVADASASAATRLGAAHGVPVLQGLEELCACDDVDAVSVCLPNGLHAAAAVTALRAGKHVLIEKPIDISLAAADGVVAAERETGLTAGVVSQRRFQPAFTFLRDAAAGGRFGTLTSGHVHTTFWRSQAYYDSGGWRGTWAGEGGGALINQGSHALDLLLWMLGEPLRVSAHAGTLAHERIEVEDTIAGTIVFAGGAIGTFTATTAAYPGSTVRMQLSGDAGTAVVEDEELRYLHCRDAETGDGDGAVNQAPSASAAQGRSSVDVAHAAQYADFVDAVAARRPPRVTTADGRRALAVVLAAYESARRGGDAVELKELDA